MDISQALGSELVGSSEYRDLVIADGDLVLTSDGSTRAVATEPVLQNIIATLLIFLGEYFLDTSVGTPFLQRIFSRRAEQADIDAILQDRILSVPGVRILNRYQSTFARAQRTFSVSFQVTTVSGTQLSYNLPLSVGTEG